MTDSEVGWAQKMANVIGTEIRRLRGGRTLRWLDERTVELGHRVSRSTLNDLENGNRTVVPLADAIVLAAALGVPVSHLVYPPDGPLVVEALPGKTIPRAEAVELLAGTAADAQNNREEIAEAMAKIAGAQATVQKLMDRLPPEDVILAEKLVNRMLGRDAG